MIENGDDSSRDHNPGETEDKDLFTVSDDEDISGGSSGGPKKNLTLFLVILLVVLVAGYFAFSSLSSKPVQNRQASVKTSPAKKIPVKPPAPVKVPTPAPVMPTAPAAQKIVQETTQKPAKKAEYPKGSTKEILKRESDVVKTPAVKQPPAKPSAPAKPVSGKGKIIKVVKAPLPVGAAKGYFVQAGVFIFKENINIPRSSIEALGYNPKIKVGSRLVRMSRVTVGNWADIKGAAALSNKLNSEGYSSKVLRLDNGTYTVMTGSYYYKNMVEEEKIILTAKGYDVKVMRVPIDMKAYYILLGPYKTPEEAAGIEANLKNNGINAAIIQPI